MIAARMTERKASIIAAKNGLRIFQHDLQDDVAGVTAAIDHLLQQIVEVAEENHVLGVVVAVVKIAQQIELEFVGIAYDGLKVVIDIAQGRNVGPLAQLRYHGEHGRRGVVEKLYLLG